MKLFVKLLLICGFVGLIGCGKKEQPAETPPAAPPQAPEVLQPQVDALHKAEDASKQATEDAIKQHKQIDEATQ
jgi:hypothetical protein